MDWTNEEEKILAQIAHEVVKVEKRIVAMPHFKAWAVAMRKAGHTIGEIRQLTAKLALCCAYNGYDEAEFAKHLKV